VGSDSRYWALNFYLYVEKLPLFNE
jgi:hypothetical protein